MDTAKPPFLSDQLIAVIVNSQNEARHADLAVSLARQDNALLKAIAEIDGVHDRIANPGRILGSPETKHGEVAEFVEVAVRRARDLIHDRPLSATFEGIMRTDAADYKIDGVEVQSKFINGIRNTLQEVKKHLGKYPGFASDDKYYHVPKDQYETIRKILHGEPVGGLSEKTINSIREKVARIEQETGRSFGDVIRPSTSDYNEVQLGKINETLDSHKQDIRDQNEKRVGGIEAEHQPSFSEALNVGIKGAAVGAGVSLAVSLYGKYRSGKIPFRNGFDASDWKDMGLDVAKGVALGGVSAAAIYAMTNYADLAAPLAGSVVSASRAVASLAVSYRNGDIEFDEFMQLGLISCTEAGAVGLCTLAGQTLIPVPVVGAMLGSFAGQLLIGFSRNTLGSRTEQLQRKLDELLSEMMARVSEAEAAVVARLSVEYNRLSCLTEVAFDVHLNSALFHQRSVELAEAYTVSGHAILRTHADLDQFIQG